MEDNLDKISKGEKIWYELCKQCDSEISEISSSITGEREDYKIDENHSYMIGKFGPVIKCVKNGKTSFKNVRKDIDITKLKNGGYKLKDLLDNSSKGNRTLLGEFKDNEVYLMNGKFGPYINCNKKNYSVGFLKKELNDITLEDVVPVLKGEVKNKNKSIIKEISNEISIRKGKYGNYVYYKTSKMKKPKFISMKGINIDEISTEWVMNKL